MNEIDNQIYSNTDRIDGIVNVFDMTEGEISYGNRELIPTKHVEGVLLTLHANRALNNVGTYQSNTPSHQYSIFNVKAGVTYLITGDIPTNTSYVVAAFYDKSGEYVSRIERTEDKLEYVDEPIVAPSGAEQIVVIKYGNRTEKIKVKEVYTLTGSSLIDNLIEDNHETDWRLSALESQLGNETLPGATISPDSTVNRSIYNVTTKTTYGDSSEYGHSFYKVTGGEHYFYTAGCGSSSNLYPAGAFYDEYGNWVQSFGTDSGASYDDELIRAPSNATQCVLNRNNGILTVILKEAVKNGNSAQNGGYNLYMADAMIRQEKKNPFAFATFDKGYVTFTFDDLTEDIDIVAAVFAEYGFPVVFAAIPARLDVIATGLSATNGDYTTGMTMRDILTQAVADGGEVIVHNSSPVVTEDNQGDFDFMYNYFVQSKKSLEKAGFNTRGIFRAGGTGAINRSTEIDRWLIGNYEYANMGTLPQYSWDRINTTVGLAEMKSRIDAAQTNHTWIQFAAHGLDIYNFGEGMSDESKLREILTYCQTVGISVVTCAYIFEHFSSSRFENYIS